MNLNQITIPVTDVERSIKFYQGLGFNLIVEALPRYARFECPDGDATFSLHQSNTAALDTGIWIYFEEGDIDHKVNELIEKGYIFDELPRDQTWLWREARIKDLDNNQLIIYYAGKNRKSPPWRL